MGMFLLLFYFPVIFVAAIFGYTIESLDALVNSWAFPIAILIFIAWVIVAISLIRTLIWWLKDRKNRVITKKRFYLPAAFTVIALALTFFDIWFAINVVSGVLIKP